MSCKTSATDLMSITVYQFIIFLVSGWLHLVFCSLFPGFILCSTQFQPPLIYWPVTSQGWGTLNLFVSPPSGVPSWQFFAQPHRPCPLRIRSLWKILHFVPWFSRSKPSRHIIPFPISVTSEWYDPATWPHFQSENLSQSSSHIEKYRTISTIIPSSYYYNSTK